MSDKLTRKEAKERTRLRLIEAVLDHVRHHGLGGLTTGKVAEAAGIAQSSFYVHFADMDDALQAAADKMGEDILHQIRERRRHVDLEHGDLRTALRGAYAGALDALLAEPAFSELLLGHRRDRSTPLGETLRAVIAHSREQLLSDLKAIGLDATPETDVDAEVIIGMTLAIIEGILDGRLTDREACLDTLVRVTLALFQPAIARKQRGS